MGILFAAASVFFAVLLLGRVLQQAAARLRERYEAVGASDLGDFLLAVEPRATWIAGAAAGAIGAILLAPFSGTAGALAAVALGGIGVPAFAARHRRRWVRQLEVQLAEGLTTVASGLRAGLSLQQAFEQLAEEAPRPLGRELAVVVRHCKLGVGLDDALERFARRAGSEDVDLVVVSVSVARRFGGNLSHLLDRIAATTRERLRIGGKVEALTAQGRMQAWIVAALPFGLLLAMAALRPDLVEPMVQSAPGRVLLALVAGFELLGLVWIRRIVAVRI